jgi:uncharacterized protein (DUF58 family)
VGVLDLFRRQRRSAAAADGAGAPAELFDDEFLRRLESLALVSRRVFAGRLRAERRTKKKGSGIEFADHRLYAPGDDIRFVDWNVYQRFGRLLVRLFEEEEDLSIYFLVDVSRSMGFGRGRKFDQARRLCAALAYVGLANLDRVTLVAVADTVQARVPPARGKGRILTVLRFLRDLTPEGRTDLRESLTRFVGQHKRKGLAVLVSDLYDPAGFEGGINVLRFNGFEPYVLHVMDPDELRPNAQGDLCIYDCETGEERDVTVTPQLLERVKRAQAEHLEAVRAFCTRNQVPYFPAGVDEPFDELVLRVFRRGGFLR